MWQGSVVSIQIAPHATAPMVSLSDVEAVAGQGLAGDRYFQRAGTYSGRAGSGRQVTLIEVETMEAVAREGGLVLEPAATRRNIATRGVPLSHLVGGASGSGTRSSKAPASASPARIFSGSPGPGSSGPWSIAAACGPTSWWAA